MASGNDFRIGLSKESVYATRVVPARFITLTGEEMAFRFRQVNPVPTPQHWRSQILIEVAVVGLVFS